MFIQRPNETQEDPTTFQIPQGILIGSSKEMIFNLILFLLMNSGAKFQPEKTPASQTKKLLGWYKKENNYNFAKVNSYITPKVKKPVKNTLRMCIFGYPGKFNF